MTRKKPMETMVVRIPAAASPARVAEVAMFLHRALEATGEPLDENSVTMIVDNFDLRVELRGRSPSGKRAVKTVGAVVTDPVKAVRKKPTAVRVAEAIAKHGTQIAKMRTKVESGGHKTSLDETSVAAIRGVAEQKTKQWHRVLGSTTTYSRVIRVGRVEPHLDVTARIEIHGAYHEVRVDDGVVSGFLDALRTDELHRVGLTMDWLVNDAMEQSLDLRSVRAVSIEAFSPISGSDLMRSVNLDEHAAISYLHSMESDA